MERVKRRNDEGDQVEGGRRQEGRFGKKERKKKKTPDMIEKVIAEVMKSG